MRQNFKNSKTARPATLLLRTHADAGRRHSLQGIYGVSQSPGFRPNLSPREGFCRSHSPRIVADREGLFEVWADDWSLVENYRFGTRSCDFLICRRYAVLLAAVTGTEEGARAVVNANCLSDRERFTSGPVVHNFEGETSETRPARHAANWMPAIIRR